VKNPLQELVGQRVVQSRIVHDYLQLILDDAGLRINNGYTISAGKEPGELQNLVLQDASQNASQVVLTFEDGITVTVSLLPEAYHGPEAMVLNREGQPTVVWN
jgi:hypothetical protein